MTEPMMKTTNIDRRTDHLSCEAALTFRECDKWTDLLSVTFRIQTKGQTSRETTEPATKTTNIDRRTDLFARKTNGQTSCVCINPTSKTMAPRKRPDLLSRIPTNGQTF